MEKEMLKSRRSFLKTGIILSGTALVGASLTFSFNPSNKFIARQLTGYLQYHHLANVIGDSVIRNDTNLQGLSLQQMIDLVLEEAGLGRSDVSLFSLFNQLETFRNAAREDFMNENIILVDGWVLSSTEAHLCALLHLYLSPSA